MAASGAKVLQLRSVEYARTHGVRIHCRSCFEDGPGTVVVGEEETMEHPLVTAVTHSTDEARITLIGVPDRPGAAALDLRGAGRRRRATSTRSSRTSRLAEARRRGLLHRPSEDLRAAERALEPGRPRARRHAMVDRRDREGLDRRRRHASPPRRRGPCLRDARRRGDQHRDDLDLADQDLLRDRAESVPRPCARSTALSSSARAASSPTRDPGERATRVSRSSARPAPSGTTMLAMLRERALPSFRARPVRLRALGGAVRRGPHRPRAHRRDGHRRLRHRALLRRGRAPRDWAPRFVEHGAIVIDNSSCWRMIPRCHSSSPRSIPRRSRPTKGSSPTRTARRCRRSSCSSRSRTRPAGANRVHLLSIDIGHRRRAIEELKDQASAILAGNEPPKPEIYPHQIAFNVLPQVETFKDGDDYTTEERKVIAESRKILGLPGLRITATCARVPVINCHSEALNVETLVDLSPDECRALLGRAPGVIVVDDHTRAAIRSPPRPPDTTRSSSGGSVATIQTPHAQPLDRRRQPAQGRGDERRTDR